ncbi:MAG TPA: homoserine kinase [Rhizomicrobium sp.]|nr:homoserine kinase [Rhizomicrobium sp.]
MAVYTDVSFDDLDALLALYDVGRPLSFKGIAEGVENSNFHLRTDRGAFILTLYEKRVQEVDLPYFLGLLDHLAFRGVPCPTPVRSRQGRLWTHVNGRPAALLTWLDGLSLLRPGTAECAAAGEACATLHGAGRDFIFARPNALGLEGWRKLAAATAAEADKVQPGLAALIGGSLAGLEREWPQHLPAGVIHADLFPDNVLFMDGQVSGLIDFYFACNDTYAYDLAVMLNAWCFESDGAYNLTKGQALLGGYGRRRGLTAAERAAFPVLARGAALRFLLTRLYDWLHPDRQALVRPKDPRDFARRLRFHLQAANAAAYGF